MAEPAETVIIHHNKALKLVVDSIQYKLKLTTTGSSIYQKNIRMQDID